MCLILNGLVSQKLDVSHLNRSKTDPEYHYTEDKECETKQKWGSLGDALAFCDNYACKGIWDKNCDGTNIYTCGKITHNSDPVSASKGCTYEKKGNKDINRHNSANVSYV